LRAFEQMLEYLRATTTTTGLRVYAEWWPQIYRTGVQIADTVMANLHIQVHAIYPAWNYTIYPRSLPLAAQRVREAIHLRTLRIKGSPIGTTAHPSGRRKK
jgi:Rhodopirellula transposase DDE domain